MPFSGIYAAIPTPFSQDEEIAYDQLERNLNYWLSQPLAGLVVLGTAGEAFYVTKEERRTLWKFCESRLHRAGRQFIAGAGAETTRDTIDYVRLAQDLGADAAMVLTPSFFRPSQEALISHYLDVAGSASIPILLYNYPAVTGVDLSADAVTALAGHPHIVGMKDSSASLTKLARIRANCPEFHVFTGIASTFYAFLSLGARGTIAALAAISAAPLEAIRQAFEAGRLDRARQIQLALANLSEAIEIRYGIPGLKYAMDRIGIYGGSLRRPLRPLCDQAKAEIDHLLAEFQGLKIEQNAP